MLNALLRVRGFPDQPGGFWRQPKRVLYSQLPAGDRLLARQFFLSVRYLWSHPGVVELLRRCSTKREK